MSVFDGVLGQQTALTTLQRALASGRIHHAYRFEGQEGVGKELAAFRFAAALVCPHLPVPPCQECLQRVTTLASEEPRVPLHPDVVLIQRGLYGKVLGAAEATGISVEQIRRLVLARAGYPPHEGKALVFIVRGADELTVQAANALLKTLEEPGKNTHFVLLTSRPKRLLDTIVSRTLRIRFGPLPDTALVTILERHGASTSVVPFAEGSASVALALADPDSIQKRESFVSAALAAVQAADARAALALADQRPPEKGELVTLLVHLAGTLATKARAVAAEAPQRAGRLARAHQIVEGALGDLERNAQPALVLETMVLELRRAR